MDIWWFYYISEFDIGLDVVTCPITGFYPTEDEVLAINQEPLLYVQYLLERLKPCQTPQKRLTHLSKTSGIKNFLCNCAARSVPALKSQCVCCFWS